MDKGFAMNGIEATCTFSGEFEMLYLILSDGDMRSSDLELTGKKATEARAHRRKKEDSMVALTRTIIYLLLEAQDMRKVLALAWLWLCDPEQWTCLVKRVCSAHTLIEKETGRAMGGYFKHADLPLCHA